jgi:hypothetical protein
MAIPDFEALLLGAAKSANLAQKPMENPRKTAKIRPKSGSNQEIRFSIINDLQM